MKVILILFALMPDGSHKKSEILVPSFDKCISIASDIGKENIRDIIPGASQFSVACVTVFEGRDS